MKSLMFLFVTLVAITHAEAQSTPKQFNCMIFAQNANELASKLIGSELLNAEACVALVENIAALKCFDNNTGEFQLKYIIDDHDSLDEYISPTSTIHCN